MTPFGHGRISGDMVGSFWLNLDHGGCSRTRVMTIFVFYVGPHFSKYSIFGYMWEYMKVYKAIWSYIKLFGGIRRYMKVYKNI